ncbi:FAD-dependent oxidoreductase [Trinickia acidisoli]|uniref:FAD-dependent oxidoreductase n=1 Tax=Trinickia acidisoli TaxID=2767482 RepID=UPI001A8D66D4|nr:FAD-dependent oxidoreductase [Trinickia acidisoli]
MTIDYQRMRFDYRPAVEQASGTPRRTHPVVVVGAGPVGLATAIDLAQRSIDVVLVDDDDCLSTGSRAICFSKRSLDIFDRLGCGEAMVEKGVRWHVGKVFLQSELVYSFDLLPESGHRRPAFINLQQYYVEGFLIERAQQLPNLEIRWKSKVVGIERVPHVRKAEADGEADAGVTLTIDAPGGEYALHARYVVAADGSRSPMRRLLGLESHGRTFKDRFLIADIKMEADFPSERWFWFDPPFHPNQSVLLHRQPDNVWRIDFQLGWDADPVLEKSPERVVPRVRALLGPDVKFEIEWVSVYTFSCLRMDSFRHGNVLFAGDAAHGVSPFGARGANSGIQDAENLAWKFEMVLTGRAPDSLLDTYAQEREYAADENILNSTRSTDFITPKSPVSHVFRDAVLSLARHYDFARRLVNSGRLSLPAVLRESTLNTSDRDRFDGGLVPGTACVDAPVLCNGSPNWLLAHLSGRFTVLLFGATGEIRADEQAAIDRVRSLGVPVDVVVVVPGRASQHSADAAVDAQAQGRVLADVEGLAAQRYDAAPGTAYLIRPDQHVCARWRQLQPEDLVLGLARALDVSGTA